jgi:uncharacterized cupin superfamily protein
MSLPANVVRTSEIEWSERDEPTPFGSRAKLFAKRLPLAELGFHLQELAPGLRSCPLHDHLFEEEQFYVFSGTLTVTERTAGGERREFELREGELIAYPAGTRLAHAFSNRTAQPAHFLALSERHPGDICTYPDSGKTALRSPMLGIGAWLAKAASASAPASAPSATAVLTSARERKDREPVRVLSIEERPAHVAAATLPERRLGHQPYAGIGTALSRAAGGRAVFVNRERIATAAPASPLQRHRFNELALLLLAGRLVLRQQQDAGESHCALVPGDIVHWPALSAAHQLQNVSTEDAVFLVFGTDRPWNLIEFPELDELHSAALQEHGRLERLDYYAGELAARDQR